MGNKVRIEFRLPVFFARYLATHPWALDVWARCFTWWLRVRGRLP